jgi:hypothetical protein
MKKIEGLSIHIAGAMALAMIFGTSAFADNRHPETTRGRSGSNEHRSGSSQSGQSRQRDQGSHGSASQRQQSGSRESFSQRERFNSGAQRGLQQRDRAFEQRDRSSQSQAFRDRSDSSRNFSRDSSRSNIGRNSGFRSTSDRGRISEGGRINRILHERGGYRVWLDRGRFSYFVPEARFRLFPLRVGLSIRFGGFYDPLGYVNVYDINPYDYDPAYGAQVYAAPAYGAPAYGAPAYSSGLLRGVVESVDYQRGTVVLNDDASGQFVTVTLNGRDRRFDDLRPGDWVELSGEFGRDGFEAYRVENFRAGHN